MANGGVANGGVETVVHVAGIEIFFKKYLHKVQMGVSIPPALWHVYLHTCKHMHGCACIY